MNVRKPVDYSVMFSALEMLIASELPQMELYCGIGRVVSSRPERGAAVAAAEYLCDSYPGASGFSPRNLRRMREFYRTYENSPEVMAEAMSIGWTQNVVILEAKLTLQERLWCILAVRHFGWSKLVLQKKIAAKAYMEISFNLNSTVCYAEETSDSNTHAVNQNKQCQATVKTGSENCFSPLLSLFHALFIHRGNCQTPLLVRRRRKQLMRAEQEAQSLAPRDLLDRQSSKSCSPRVEKLCFFLSTNTQATNTTGKPIPASTPA